MGIGGVKDLLEGPLGTSLSADFPDECLKARTVIGVDMATRMFRLVGTHGINLKRVMAKLDAYCLELFSWCETLFLTVEIDTHVVEIKHMVKGDRLKKHQALSKEECGMISTNGRLPDYNRIRATRGLRDWLFETMMQHLRTNFKVPFGKRLITGPTAAAPTRAYVKNCITNGKDAVENPEVAMWECMIVPITGEADLALSFWADHFSEYPRIIIANDIDMVPILTLGAYRDAARINNCDDLRPLYLFRHKLHLTAYLHDISDQTTLSRSDSAGSGGGGYSLPFTNIQTVLELIYDMSWPTKDPAPVASFTMLVTLRGCDFIKKTMFKGIPTHNVLFHYWTYKGPAFVDLVPSETVTTVLVNVDALAAFQKWLYTRLSKKIPKGCLVGAEMHASIRRAAYVLYMWVNAHLGETYLPDALGRQTVVSTCGWEHNQNGKPVEAMQVSKTLPDDVWCGKMHLL
jgi:hypothetical protein